MLLAVLFILLIADVKSVISDEPLSSISLQTRLLEKMIKMEMNIQKIMEKNDKKENEKEQEKGEISRLLNSGRKELLVEELQRDGWEMVFRATSSNGQNVYDAWTLGKGVCSEKPASMARSHSSHYRNNIVSNWPSIGAKYVKYAFYERNQEVVYVIFNATGSDMNSWFDRHRVIASSYTDLTTTQTYNFFSVVGGLSPNRYERRFFINILYNTCAGDKGYLAVSDDEPPNNVCNWDKHPKYPQFLYSKINTADFWGSLMFGRADYMAIFIKSEY